MQRIKFPESRMQLIKSKDRYHFIFNTMHLNNATTISMVVSFADCRSLNFNDGLVKEAVHSLNAGGSIIMIKDQMITKNNYNME